MTQQQKSTRGIDSAIGKNNGYYQVFDCQSPVDPDFLTSFNDLEEDRYLKEDWCYRYRAYGAASFEKDRVIWDSSATFYQSETINAYAGGQIRTFAALPEVTRHFSEAVLLHPEIREVMGTSTFRMGCHQIRICADDHHNGLPTPEGFHQDGFDVVMIICINQSNVSGGVSLLCQKDNREEILFNRIMAPGESLLINDREMMHYVSPITPRLPGFAYRDVIVLTFER